MQGNKTMRSKNALKLLMGAMLFATLAYAVLAVPGLISDTASTVPTLPQEAQR